jgi:hypothetical protein
LRCHIGISKSGRGGRRYLPYVFTEHGIAILSGVLKSPGAVAVNIEIMRAFVGDPVGAIATRRAACAETRPPVTRFAMFDGRVGVPPTVRCRSLFDES